MNDSFRLELPDKTTCRQLTESYVQLESLETPAMKLTDFVADVPDDVWAVFEPVLPAVVWKGTGRKPKSNHACLHALLYVLIAGIGWELLPKCFPSYKTVQRRLKRWLALDCFHTAWQQLAQRYVQLHGINWDQVLLDGSKKPSKKGVKTQGHRRWIVVSPVLPST
jgi:transposase